MFVGVKSRTAPRALCLAVAFLALFAGSELAADEVVLDAATIQKTLAGATVESLDQGWRQIFMANGETTYYAAGRNPTYGRWSVRAPNLYCSLWPPAESWTCYRVSGEGDRITWVTLDGSSYSQARILERKGP